MSTIPLGGDAHRSSSSLSAEDRRRFGLDRSESPPADRGAGNESVGRQQYGAGGGAVGDWDRTNGSRGIGIQPQHRLGAQQPPPSFGSSPAPAYGKPAMQTQKFGGLQQ